MVPLSLIIFNIVICTHEPIHSQRGKKFKIDCSILKADKFVGDIKWNDQYLTCFNYIILPPSMVTFTDPFKI